mmetsp:Transcript_17079/g.19432  ORF Transcript_17079/g.19432 Transcript_17079/m.19432 type:complete len:220 (+) Transcript_17079:42-701(+)
MATRTRLLSAVSGQAKKKLKAGTVKAQNLGEQLAEKSRCKWCESHQIYIDYHDNEWGIPTYNDNELFEMLSLEGAQAGLSWITILRKRAEYRKVFQKFDVETVAKYGQKEIGAALENPGIVRHKGKIHSVVNNAKAVLDIQADPDYGSFSKFVWSFAVEDSERNKNAHTQSVSPESKQMSKELKKRGFKFVGPTTCYSFMQACGIVNDHSPDCFRYKKR